MIGCRTTRAAATRAAVPVVLTLALALAPPGCAPAHQRRPIAAPPTSRPLTTVAARRPASRPAAAAPRPRYPSYRIFESPGGAMVEVLRGAPRVIGFGEYHQKVSSAKVQSPLRRFTNQILEHVADRASDLILELAVPEGDCGGKVDRVAKKVERTTERPAATENEAVTLILRARRLGVRPHVLNLACKVYNELLGAESEDVDYQKLLTVITQQLLAKAREALARPVRFDALGELRGLVLLYGGALHNDLHPQRDLAAYSYAAALRRLTKGRYVELDLYVPEYVEGDKDLRQESWYPLLKRAAKEHVVLVERGPQSYILILQRGLAAP